MPSRRSLLIACTVATGATWIGATTAVSLPAFTTAAKSRTVPASTPQATLASVTVGRHATFDRIVFRWRGSTPGYQVRYIPQVIGDGSGEPIPVRGRYFLGIRFEPTVNGTTAGVPSTYTPLFPTLRQMKVSGDFEGVVNFGAGLSKRAGFRVFTLSSPRRIVVDVKH